MNEFLKDAFVLIVSSKPSHRTGVRKILVDLGASNHHIESAPDFAQAKERLTKEPVNILICDDDIGSQGTAIDLIKLFTQNNPRAHSRLMILMPGSDTDQLRENFIKEGGDLIIDKPYTSATFITPFKKIIEDKYAYTFDEKMALDVEDALNKNNRDMALEYYKTIKNPNSPSASYSIGMISMFDKDYSKAYNHFQKSIQGKVDVKVLVNLVDSGVKTQKYQELDKYVEQWIKKFPLKSESVPDVTRVVLFNKKFALLNEMNIDDKTAKIPLAAGLVIASSVFLDRGDTGKSIQYAIKGIECSGNKPSIVLKAMEILVQAGALKEAQKIFEDLNLKASINPDKTLIKTLETLLAIN
jgi:CheY-like chemotaxis protein